MPLQKVTTRNARQTSLLCGTISVDHGKGVSGLMANRTVAVVVSDTDYETLTHLAKVGHSYPATVARFLLAEALNGKGKESAEEPSEDQ